MLINGKRYLRIWEVGEREWDIKKKSSTGTKMNEKILSCLKIN